MVKNQIKQNFNYGYKNFLLSFALRLTFKPVVLKLLCMFYPFNKDDYQTYPQYIKRCSFIKKTKETIYISFF